MHAAVVLGLCAAVVVVVLGAGHFRGKHQTAREARAERVVQLQLREDVTCRDQHTINTDVVPDAPGYYQCKNSAGETYLAIVSPNGLLRELDGPLPSNPAE